MKHFESPSPQSFRPLARQDKLCYFGQNILFVVKLNRNSQDSRVRRGQSNFSSVLICVNCEEKGYYRVVSVGS